MGRAPILLAFLPLVVILGSNSTETDADSTASPDESTAPAEEDLTSSTTTSTASPLEENGTSLTTTPASLTVQQTVVAKVNVPDGATSESLSQSSDFRLWIQNGIAKTIKNVTGTNISADAIVITNISFGMSGNETRRLAIEETIEIDYYVMVANVAEATAVVDFAESEDARTTLMDVMNTELENTELGGDFSITTVIGVSTVADGGTTTVGKGDVLDAARGLVCVPLVLVVAMAAALCA